jgi:ribosomal protein S18 acetylase RimI-like enzyme
MTESPPTSSTVSIRKATTADAPAIAAVHVRSWVATYTKLPSGSGIDRDIAHRADLWEQRLQQKGIDRQVCVAVENGAVAGFIYFGPSPDVEDNPVLVGQIFSVHVEPVLTHRGIGRRLMEHAVHELAASGCSSATLWVVVSNEDSRRFYEATGWRSDGKHRWEELALEGEQGDQVEVMRYHLELAPKAEKTNEHR